MNGQHAAAEAEVLHHRSALGEWQWVVRPPAARLRGDVLGYHGYAEHVVSFARRIEAPSPVVPLILNFGSPYRVSGPGGRGPGYALSSFAAGLYDGYALVEASGPTSGLQVNFTPLGARRFFGFPLGEIANRSVDLVDLLGPAANHLVERLAALPGWMARFALLDALIVARLGEAPPAPAHVAYAWRRLHETDGRIGAGALAAELGCSRKHLAAGFRDQIGLPPAAAGRILRFNHALRLLERGGGPCGAQVALAAGYFDQAHFNREFRAFTGRTPREFLSRRLPDGGVLGD
jgi:AraC-like DNA-binding protein